MLVGAVGEVTAVLSIPYEPGIGTCYSVDFPAHRDVRCPGCGKEHFRQGFPMADNELRPLNDPDEGVAQETETPVEFGFTASA